MKTKNESLKTLDLNKLNAVTGGAWNGQSPSWNNSNWSGAAAQPAQSWWK